MRPACWVMLAAVAAAGCTPEPPAPPPPPATATLDALAERFVRLTLEIGEREPGYVDAYYGPPEWAEAARAAPREVPALRAEAERLGLELEALDLAASEVLVQRRRAFLRAQARAAQTRLRMLAGQRLGFVEEAQGLFAVAVSPPPLASFDPVLDEIEALLPGSGELADRVDALLARSAIPVARAEAVMRAAIDACRERTASRIPLPAHERFELEFVTGKSWSGYNWYQGNAHSLIQINTDLPLLISRATDLGCHEGYPGHHVLNLLLEERLTRARGWVEFSIYPLYSPQSLIAEGSANYGIELAFPGEARLAFEREVLYPLAGLDPALAAQVFAVQQAKARLDLARITIAADYLDGTIDRERALELTRRYLLVSAARAEQLTAFTEQYRSYVINYGLGQQMVRDHIEAAGEDPAARWAAMERLLNEPTLPADLVPGAGNR